ncbi:MAG TPA: 4-hydroxythreonine-4-phosphate dehydrogenase PdxA, partial [Thermodesulfobacteriota bacterium]|nr:4-hydroxythreonine-4-phosphate dehydrogenase PdxA [Thermodesulfobacteriota bacterium]
ASAAVQAAVVPIVIGHLPTLRRAAPELADRLLPLEAPRRELPPGTIGVLDVGLPRRPLAWGVLDAEAGRAAVAYVLAAVDHALAGRLDAVATAPLNKEAMHAAGYRYPGHTELLAERTGARDYALALVSDALRVIHVSTHVPLREAIARVTVERVLTVIRLADRLCRDLEVPAPRIGVAGLNPHAGEHGLFGDEEARAIAPAVAAARAEGLDAAGPLPPDTLFHRAVAGRAFDIVVAMYHDQGHIPFKTLYVDRGVNVTAGLPIVRTSVDHGTAFDIAGRGLARWESMAEAILLAGRMARARAAAARPAGAEG